MDESILVPSPNWFKVSGLALTKDNWMVYGGPGKSLCVLEPASNEYHRVFQEPQHHRVHVYNKAHIDKIVSVDISPEWPEKRHILTGAADGSVKHWQIDESEIEKIKPLLSHDVHVKNKEEVAGVGYSNNIYAITVGVLGYIVKWDLSSNLVQTYQNLKKFKPVCMACSHHIPLNIAVGTKQGVVFVLDLRGSGHIVFKVRGQDDEIVGISWCPQYEVTVKKAFRGCKTKDSKSNNVIETAQKDDTNNSATEKDLPEDSFEDSEVEPEDDMFDIYKDHESDEFGHKKYEPEDIIVKVKEEKQQEDYLSECLKLKEEILKRKSKSETSIETLVEALDKAHVNDSSQEVPKCNPEPSAANKQNNEQSDSPETNIQIQKHLLATISRLGNVCIWSKSGKLLATCAVSNVNKNHKFKICFSPCLLWYKSNVLLLSDVKNQLLQCDPLNVNNKNQVQFKVVHSLHKRPAYSIISAAPRVQTTHDSDEDWPIWTAAQDRRLIQYSLEKGQQLMKYDTCGGFVYSVAPCPYDANKVAVAIGDGSVKVLEFETVENDDTQLKVCNATSYWQNVRGKVLTIAWHPKRENLLAFATAESRVGLINTSSNVEKPAKLLEPVGMSCGVYSIAWGGHRTLYVSASGHLLLYNNVNQAHQEPERIDVVVEGQRWSISAIHRVPDRQTFQPALVVGSEKGGVAVLSYPPQHNVLAAVFVASRSIYTIDWHPWQTSNSTEVSPYKNLLAVSSINKQNHIVILEYVEKEDGKNNQLLVWKTLVGHKNSVYTVKWNPHHDGILLSTSLDYTARVWDARSGECVSVCGQHGATVLCGAWALQPRLADVALTGGGDYTLRAWRRAHCPPHLAELYENSGTDPQLKKNHRKAKALENEKVREQMLAQSQEEPANECKNACDVIVANDKVKVIASRRFLLPVTSKLISTELNTESIRQMLQQYLKKKCIDNIYPTEESTEKREDSGVLKMFGSINDVNELLDTELARHESTGNIEAYVVLCVFRGHIDSVVQYATQRDMLCPYILSLAPCVSFKYWKDVCQLYIAQLDRLKAKGAEDKLYGNRTYGGSVFRKVTTQLSVHDVKGAVETLLEGQLFKEAYILCRIRYMDNIAVEVLQRWANHCVQSGLGIVAAVCYIALEDLPQAAITLGKMNKEEALQLAADIAKISGQNKYAEHVTKKREEILSEIQNEEASDPTEEILRELPTRIEALMDNGNGITIDDLPQAGITIEKINKQETHEITVDEMKITAEHVSRKQEENPSEINNKETLDKGIIDAN